MNQIGGKYALIDFCTFVIVFNCDLLFYKQTFMYQTDTML